MMPSWLNAFITEQRLPSSFAELAVRHYLPLVEKIGQWVNEKGSTLILGVNGAQGTGKSTLADVLSIALGLNNGLKVAVLSIDDLYLTKQERKALSAEVHPLLQTRGVPGTHDVELGLSILEKVESGGEFELPVFDKSVDDRAESGVHLNGRFDVLILEGWCVGAKPQHEDALVAPMNDLEKNEVADGEWRRFVNGSLSGGYQELFSKLDKLVMLKAPSFECVYEWRGEQERKLRDVRGDAEGVMSEVELERFIMHYERLTNWMLEEMPERADVVLELASDHSMKE